MADVFLQVALDVAEQGHIADGSGNEQNQGANEDYNSKDHGEEQHGCNWRVVPVRRNVVRLKVVCVRERVEGQSVD